MTRDSQQLWPFCPETCPSGPGTGHQPVLVSTLGHLPSMWQGTGPAHGIISLSTALRGGGFTTAPWPMARPTAHARTNIFFILRVSGAARAQAAGRVCPRGRNGPGLGQSACLRRQPARARPVDQFLRDRDRGTSLLGTLGSALDTGK